MRIFRNLKVDYTSTTFLPGPPQHNLEDNLQRSWLQRIIFFSLCLGSVPFHFVFHSGSQFWPPRLYFGLGSVTSFSKGWYCFALCIYLFLTHTCILYLLVFSFALIVRLLKKRMQPLGQNLWDTSVPIACRYLSCFPSLSLTLPCSSIFFLLLLFLLHNYAALGAYFTSTTYYFFLHLHSNICKNLTLHLNSLIVQAWDPDIWSTLADLPTITFSGIQVLRQLISFMLRTKISTILCPFNISHYHYF